MENGKNQNEDSQLSKAFLETVFSEN